MELTMIALELHSSNRYVRYTGRKMIRSVADRSGGYYRGEMTRNFSKSHLLQEIENASNFTQTIDFENLFEGIHLPSIVRQRVELIILDFPNGIFSKFSKKSRFVN